jgi:four helix bundle protein
MAGWRSFEEIGGWQRARELKLLAFELLARPNVAKDFKFRDQLVDSARSAPRNIAEGFARFKHKEFAQFARVAKGSAAIRERKSEEASKTESTLRHLRTVAPEHRTHLRNRTHSTDRAARATLDLFDLDLSDVVARIQPALGNRSVGDFQGDVVGSWRGRFPGVFP